MGIENKSTAPAEAQKTEEVKKQSLEDTIKDKLVDGVITKEEAAEIKKSLEAEKKELTKETQKELTKLLSEAILSKYADDIKKGSKIDSSVIFDEIQLNNGKTFSINKAIIDSWALGELGVDRKELFEALNNAQKNNKVQEPAKPTVKTEKKDEIVKSAVEVKVDKNELTVGIDLKDSKKVMNLIGEQIHEFDLNKPINLINGKTKEKIIIACQDEFYESEKGNLLLFTISGKGYISGGERYDLEGNKYNGKIGDLASWKPENKKETQMVNKDESKKTPEKQEVKKVLGNNVHLRTLDGENLHESGVKLKKGEEVSIKKGEEYTMGKYNMIPVSYKGKDYYIADKYVK